MSIPNSINPFPIFVVNKLQVSNNNFKALQKQQIQSITCNDCLLAELISIFILMLLPSIFNDTFEPLSPAGDGWTAEAGKLLAPLDLTSPCTVFSRGFSDWDLSRGLSECDLLWWRSLSLLSLFSLLSLVLCELLLLLELCFGLDDESSLGFELLLEELWLLSPEWLELLWDFEWELEWWCSFDLEWSLSLCEEDDDELTLCLSWSLFELLDKSFEWPDEDEWELWCLCSFDVESPLGLDEDDDELRWPLLLLWPSLCPSRCREGSLDEDELLLGFGDFIWSPSRIGIAVDTGGPMVETAGPFRFCPLARWPNALEVNSVGARPKDKLAFAVINMSHKLVTT